MVQTGDPTGSGKGGQSIWGAPFADEIRSTLKVRFTRLPGLFLLQYPFDARAFIYLLFLRFLHPELPWSLSLDVIGTFE